MATFLSNDDDQQLVSFLDIEKMLIEAVGEISGVDMSGREYKGIEDLWNVELSNCLPAPWININSEESDDNDDERIEESQTLSKNNKAHVEENGISEKGHRWYNNAYDFWEDEKNCPITDDGVLGGYGKITPEDVKGSNAFLDQLAVVRPSLCFDHAADCGAGIGRVAKHLLLHRFNYVDIVEQSPRLLAAAPEYIGEMSSRATYIVQKLQDFAPEPNSYDAIWIQWVLGHLHDHDVIQFYRRCAKGLRPGGVIILKVILPLTLFYRCAKMNYAFIYNLILYIAI